MSTYIKYDNHNNTYTVRVEDSTVASGDWTNSIMYTDEPSLDNAIEKYTSKKKTGSTAPKKKDLSPFTELLLKESCFGGDVKRVSSIVIGVNKDPLLNEVTKELPNGTRWIVEYDAENNYSYLESTPSRNLVITLDVLNYFPTMMEAALFLKEISHFNGGNNPWVILKTMSYETVKKQKKSKIKLLKGFTEAELIELAYFAGYRERIKTTELHKTDDPCIIVRR